MKRAKFIRLTVAVMLVVVALMVPLAADAQLTVRPVKIGVVCVGGCPFGGPGAEYRPLIEALGRVGLVQGQSLAWDIGGVVVSEEMIKAEAMKLVSRRPDLILVWAGNVTAARVVKDATKTIPIVLMAMPDAVENGLVASLGRPGGNITGMSVPTYDLTIKQLEVLKEINPRLKSIIVFQGDLDRGERQTLDRLRGAAASLHLNTSITVTDVRSVEQALAAAPPGASTVLAIGNIPYVVLARVKRLALERQLPLIIPGQPWEGGRGRVTLIAYGPRYSVVAERTAVLIDRILKGARPADLPVEQATSYELTIDGVMAKALGLTIPPGVRARADEVLD